MRRLLTIMMMATMLGAMVLPVPVGAQGGNPCDAYVPVDAPEGVTLSGGAGRQVLIGSNGPDVLDGGSGDDILCGFGGDDTLIGGSGSDWLDGDTGYDVLQGNSGNDSLVNGEDNQEGSGSDDVLRFRSVVITMAAVQNGECTVTWTLNNGVAGETVYIYTPFNDGYFEWYLRGTTGEVSGNISSGSYMVGNTAYVMGSGDPVAVSYPPTVCGA